MSTTKQSNVYRQRRAVREEDEVMMEVTLLMANLSIGEEPHPFKWQTGENNAPPCERAGAADGQPPKSRRKMNNLPRRRKEAKPKRKKNFRRAVTEDKPMKELTQLMVNLSIGDQPQTGVNNAPPSKSFGAADGESAKPQRKRANKRKLDTSTAAHDHSPDRFVQAENLRRFNVW